MKPTFSVIIPTLNEEAFLPKLLTSLTDQTEKTFEVILVDGSSADATVERAKLFTKKLPKLVVQVTKNSGLPMQRNEGANSSRGEWLIFIDADVVLLPYFFQRVRTYIDRVHPEFFTTWFRPDSDNARDAILTLMINVFVEGGLLLNRQVSPGGMTIIKRNIFERLGRYNESLLFGEDFDLTQRAKTARVPLKILRETLYVLSLRRFRREGKLKVIKTYAKATLVALLTKHAPKNMEDYLMGGHLYRK